MFYEKMDIYSAKKNIFLDSRLDFFAVWHSVAHFFQGFWVTWCLKHVKTFTGIFFTPTFDVIGLNSGIFDIPQTPIFVSK